MNKIERTRSTFVDIGGSECKVRYIASKVARLYISTQHPVVVETTIVPSEPFLAAS